MTPSSAKRTIAWWVVFAAVAGTVIVIRLRLLAMPLERDEGEYAYAGQLLLDGIAPYKFAYNMKFPGAYVTYAGFIALFGQTPAAIHLALVLVNLATAALLFAIALRLTDNRFAGIAAALTYLVTTLHPAVLGLATHVEHLVLLPTLSGFLLLLAKINLRRTVVAGVLLGIAIIMKQPAVFFAVAALLWVLHREFWESGMKRALTSGTAFCCGVALPVSLMIVALCAAGVFSTFWFWTIEYARAYGSAVSLHEGLLIAAKKSRTVLAAVWPFALIAASGSWFIARGSRRVFTLLLSIAAVTAWSAGLYFREHYFVYLLPVLAISCGAAVALLERAKLSLVALPLLLAASAYVIANRAQLFFRATPKQACAEIYRGNIFSEAPQLGAFLRDQTGPGETIAVLGSEPEIYFYAHRRSATGYIYTYALMEEQPFVRRMQQQMQEEIEKAQPKFVVFVTEPMSWGVGSWSDVSIFRWANEFTSAKYQAIGAVNVLPNRDADYCLPCTREMEPWPPSALVLQRIAP
jgi:4-amino-4-deoxy-L-arabinose transferase-like glycosyltransferase